MTTLLLAEIGVNHNGDLDTALALVDMAAECGAGAVKFQKRTPALHVPPGQRDTLRDTPFGPMTHWDYRHRVEFGPTEYDALAARCDRLGLPWSVSVWDEPSVDFMRRYSPPWLKIPSAMLTNHRLLDYAAGTGTPLVLSTGMSTKAEVDEAVARVPVVTGASVFVCHSAYPSPEAEMDLRQIETYRREYPHAVGFSSHAVSPYPAIYAAVLGAQCVECHITLDRSMPGSDQAASLEAPGLALVARELRRVDALLSDGQKRLWDSELAARKRLRG